MTPDERPSTWSELITDWQAATFGTVTRERAWARFEEELEELIEADCEPREPNEKLAAEAADAVITLAAWVKAATGLDLADAVERKMAINRAREWRQDPDGMFRNAKGGAE
jgi:hypothetical protein